jgi:putative FmdB family regulatory protein
MPIYAFQCQACGHRFDRLQKLSDADPTTCPECAQESVTRQLTAPSFRLAGGGWYETDFKKDGKRNLAEKGDGGSGSGEAPKADAKPEAKADARPAAAPATTPAPSAKPTKD